MTKIQAIEQLISEKKFDIIRSNELLVGDIVKIDESNFEEIRRIEISSKGKIVVYWNCYNKEVYSSFWMSKGFPSDQKMTIIDRNEYSNILVKIAKEKEKEEQERNRKNALTVGYVRKLIENQPDDAFITTYQDEEGNYYVYQLGIEQK